MRLWSLHPKYLDSIGLIALWRESLLAQKVLQGKTKGYRNHPQIFRFRDHPKPVAAIANYLIGVWKESVRRGYRFDKSKIAGSGWVSKIPVTSGQLEHEFKWLMTKLTTRDPDRYKQLLLMDGIECHPSFKVIEGPVADWEYSDSKSK